MSSLLKYYAFLTVLFIVVVIYNISFRSTFAMDQCKIKSCTAAARILPAVPKASINATSNSTGPVCTIVTSSIQLTKLPLIIVIVYGAMAGLSVLALIGIQQFGDMPSERFGSLPWYWAGCGIYVRNFAFLIKMASYVALLLILVQAFLVFLTDDCKTAAHIDKQGNEVIGQMYQQSITVLMVDLCFFGFTHCLLPVLKGSLDQEAFLYEPIDNTANKAYYLLCNYFGP